VFETRWIEVSGASRPPLSRFPRQSAAELVTRSQGPRQHRRAYCAADMLRNRSSANDYCASSTVTRRRPATFFSSGVNSLPSGEGTRIPRRWLTLLNDLVESRATHTGEWTDDAAPDVAEQRREKRTPCGVPNRHGHYISGKHRACSLYRRLSQIRRRNRRTSEFLRLRGARGIKGCNCFKTEPDRMERNSRSDNPESSH
jgi:hypothetical protein